MSNDRPPMHQTLTPFVEFFINGVDILRDVEGRPRTLVSFEHYITLGSTGDWSIEVFDPSFVSIEELCFVTQNKGVGTETAEEAYGAEPGDATQEEVTHPVAFRYGYVSQDGVEIISPSSGLEYFVGFILSYTPTIQPNGSLISLRGKTTWTPDNKGSSRTNSTFYDMKIIDIIRTVCKRMEWTLVPANGSTGADVSGAEELEFPEGEIPEEMTDVSYGIDTTEEQQMTIRMPEGESEFNFIKSLLKLARPVDQKFNEYDCRLEYRAEGDPKAGSEGLKPKGYLIYGPADLLKEPVRDYFYMRDKESDIISFSPNIAVFPGAITRGAVVKMDNKRTGEMAVHQYNEVDRYLKYFGDRRRKLTRSAAELGSLQQGEPEQPENADNIEGSNTGPNVNAPANKPDPDDPSTEESLHVTNAYEGDRQYMSFWLNMQNFMTSATLEVVGDPSADMRPWATVGVYVLVPTENDEFRFHWTSSVWYVKGVSHHFSQGSYVTRLDLCKNAAGIGSGIASKAAYASLDRSLESRGMSKKTGN